MSERAAVYLQEVRKAKHEGKTPDPRMVEYLVREGWRAILATNLARSTIWELMQGLGIRSTAFNGNSRDILLNGKRHAALHIDAQLRQYAPDLYVQMLHENDEVFG